MQINSVVVCISPYLWEISQKCITKYYQVVILTFWRDFFRENACKMWQSLS